MFERVCAKIDYRGRPYNRWNSQQQATLSIQNIIDSFWKTMEKKERSKTTTNALNHYWLVTVLVCCCHACLYVSFFYSILTLLLWFWWLFGLLLSLFISFWHLCSKQQFNVKKATRRRITSSSSRPWVHYYIYIQLTQVLVVFLIFLRMLCILCTRTFYSFARSFIHAFVRWTIQGNISLIISISTIFRCK